MPSDAELRALLERCRRRALDSRSSAYDEFGAGKESAYTDVADELESLIASQGAEQAARARLGRWLAAKPMRQWNVFWHMGRCFVKVCCKTIYEGPFRDTEHEAINAALDAAERSGT